jgi:hypothetical protein
VHYPGDWTFVILNGIQQCTKRLFRRAKHRKTEAREFPGILASQLVSRLSDISSDATYEPDEVASFLEELLRAQQIVKKPRSIRGLDNLIRIARWAQELSVGIHFGGV